MAHACIADAPAIPAVVMSFAVGDRFVSAALQNREPWVFRVGVVGQRSLAEVKRGTTVGLDQSHKAALCAEADLNFR